jgi:hypothetical protein
LRPASEAQDGDNVIGRARPFGEELGASRVKDGKATVLVGCPRRSNTGA